MKKTGYICGIAWQHEAGETDIKVYESIEHLKEKEECWGECGIVEISLEEVKWVVPQNIRGDK